MKHDYPNQDYTFFTLGTSRSTTSTVGNFPSLPPDATGKSKMWDDFDNEDAGGIDELLAVLGYKVKSSDMVDVAQKIEHLEGVLQNDKGLS